MHLKYNYWYFSKVIKKEICNEIISICSKQRQYAGKLGEQKMVKNKRWGGLKSSYRNCKVAWISSKRIYDILNPFIHRANKEAGWNFQWDWNEPSQFTIYNKNNFYSWHNDQTTFKKHKNNNFNNKIRKLSLTLQLTEPSEYEGGDLQFKYFDKKTIQISTPKIAKELGSIIIFPSFIWHQVTPIIKGERQALVNWSLGRPFI